MVVFSPGDFKGTAVDGRAPRLSRVQPRLRSAMLEPLLLRKEDKKHVDNTKNTPRQAVSFQMQAGLWCSWDLMLQGCTSRPAAHKSTGHKHPLHQPREEIPQLARLHLHGIKPLGHDYDVEISSHRAELALPSAGDSSPHAHLWRCRRSQHAKDASNYSQEEQRQHLTASSTTYTTQGRRWTRRRFDELTYTQTD